VSAPGRPKRESPLGGAARSALGGAMSAPGRPKRVWGFSLRLLGWAGGLCGLVLVFQAWLSADMLLALASGTFLCG